MERSSLLPIIAIAVSIAALTVSLISRQQAPAKPDIESEVESALAKREKKLARELAPKMQEVYADMLGSDENAFETPPETLRELLAPALRVIQGIADGS